MNFLDSWDRTLLNLSSKCVEPFCLASWAYYKVISPLDPDKFDNCDSKIKEIAYRGFITLTAAASLASVVIPITMIGLGIISKVLRVVGFALQKDGYTHVRSETKEKILTDQAKVMTWNICGIGGGLHYDHGGMIDWQARLDKIVEMIKNQDSDVLVLQEIYDTALAEALIEKLQSDYAHFFIHLGANIIGSVGGLMVLSKCAVHKFTNISFMNNHWTLNRTFATLEIKARPGDDQPCARIVGTHFIHANPKAAQVQVAQVMANLQTLPPIPTLLVGDLNLERDRPEQSEILNPYFEHGYLGKEQTRTKVMLKMWDKTLKDPGKFIDYISLYKQYGGKLQSTRLIPAYSPDFNTKTALSDHNALIADLVW